VDERADAKRDDQRIDAEKDDKEAIHESDQRADSERSQNGPGDWHTETRIEQRQHHAGEGQIAGDGEIVVIAGERNHQAERENNDHGL
jgi:hypothetical protein